MSNLNGLSDRILIAVDEAKSARAVQRLLATAGYDAVAFDSVDAAREELRAHEFSLIILESSASRLTDSSPPSTNCDSGESLRRMLWAKAALAFCADVRARDTANDIPILMISKSHRPQDKIVCLNEGATDYITRPYQRAELLSRVRVHLRSRERSTIRATKRAAHRVLGTCKLT